MRSKAFFFPKGINAGWQRGSAPVKLGALCPRSGRGGTVMVTRHGLRYCLLVGVVWLLVKG